MITETKVKIEEVEYTVAMMTAGQNAAILDLQYVDAQGNFRGNVGSVRLMRVFFSLRSPKMTRENVEAMPTDHFDKLYDEVCKVNKLPLLKLPNWSVSQEDSPQQKNESTESSA